MPDPGLTELGHQQAKALAEYFWDQPPTHIYCSAFRRALETTRPLVDRLKVIPEVRWDLFEQGDVTKDTFLEQSSPRLEWGDVRFKSCSVIGRLTEISDHGWYQGILSNPTKWRWRVQSALQIG